MSGIIPTPDYRNPHDRGHQSSIGSARTNHEVELTQPFSDDVMRGFWDELVRTGELKRPYSTSIDLTRATIQWMSRQ